MALILALALQPGTEDGGAIELIPPDEQIAPNDTSPGPPAPLAAEAAPAPPQVSLEGLRLHGILSDAAVIGLPGGGQRLVRVGRDLLPGVTLAEVRQDRILLAQGGARIELGFAGEVSDGGASADMRSEAVRGAPAPPVASAPVQAEVRRQALEYRLGLEPRRAGGRTIGFALRPGARLPMLERAGLRQDDVILSVNGQAFDSEEKVLELPLEIAGSYTATFEFERGGRRMTASLPVNPRPREP